MSTIIIDGKTIEHHAPFPSNVYNVPTYDQRYMPRWRTNKRAFYRLSGVPVIAKTEVIDLNVDGVCLYVTDDVHPSQQLDIKVYLTDKVSFETTGIVIWKRSRPNGHFFAGLLFDKLPDETQEMILEYAFNSNDLFDLSLV